MTDAIDSEEPTLAPDDAFAILRNETRMQILRSLGDANEPVALSELREVVGMGDNGRLNTIWTN